MAGAKPRASGTAPRKVRPKPPDRSLAFDDVRLLAEVCGENDRHLAQIEKALTVALVPRGDRIDMAGPADAVALAAAILERLYAAARTGQVIDPGAVDGALRMAMGRGAAHAVRSGHVIRTQKRTIEPRSPAQAVYMDALGANELVFGLGPAGTGKTYIAVAHGVSLLINREVDRLILSRPAVEAGERLGFLPGDMREKIDPYLRPLYDALDDTMIGDQVQRRLESGEIEIAPLAFMRGRTLSRAYVILDEAQNTTSMQMRMFLTRLGEGSRMVVTGDPSQVDLPPGVDSGLHEARRVLQGVEGIGFATFTDADVVRHPLVGRIVKAYNAARQGPKDGGDAAP